MNRILDKKETRDSSEYPFDTVPEADGYWLEWLAGLLLVLAFTIQLVYFDHTTIRPHQLLCAKWQFACLGPQASSRLPLELRQIELVQADVQVHSDVAGALLIQASLINYRNYALQYPRLEMQFFDLTGQLRASRFFQPQEYLLPGTSLSTGLPPGVPVQVLLEVLDPGLSTLSYEFHLR